MDVDHYAILGLPSGEQGAKLTEKEISKAYRAKALELHPDKRPDDPNAHANFQMLKSSYEILKDEKARKLFDDLLRVKREQHRRQSERDSKRQKMMTDLEARERSAFAPDPAAREQEEEEKIAKKLKEEIARIRAMHAKKGEPTTFAPKKETGGVGKNSDCGAGTTMDKERMLKVSWEKIGEDYTAEKLREIFSKCGEVEDVVIRHNKKKKGSAVIVMSSKEAAIASCRSVLGDLSNPLLVLPLQPASFMEMPSAERSPEHNRLNNLVGAGYQAFEDSILKKLQKMSESEDSSRKDPAWKYARSEKPSDVNTFVCGFCGKITKGGVYRMKQHLVGGFRNAAACRKCPEHVKEEIRIFMTNKKEIKQQRNLVSDSNDVDTEQYGIYEECDEEDVSVSGKRLASSSSSQSSLKKQKTKGPMDAFFPPNPIGASATNIKQTTLNAAYKKEMRANVIQSIARWFYDTGIHLNACNYESFGPMIEAIGQFGPGLKPPTYHELRVPCLKKEIENTEEMMKAHKEQWAKVGCTITTDGWTDRRNRTLLNFLVNSPKGTVFIESIDASNVVKDGNKMFQLIDDFVERIGEDNVVQVVTDSALANVMAGRLLEAKRPTIFWSPCAAHCLDLMLEDIFKISKLRKTLKRAMEISNFIYARPGLLNMMRTFTSSKELIRPAKTRFATASITLSSIYTQKANLRKMFTSDEWKNSKWSKEQQGKRVLQTIMMAGFWNTIVFALKVSCPLVRVLRLVDGEKKPPMGYIYEAMDRAKESIAKAFNFKEEKYNEIYTIIDRRWDLQLHRPLHAAGYYLNPEFFYKYPSIQDNTEITDGLYACITRMITSLEQQDKVLGELSKYKEAEESFGSPLAIRNRDKRSPVEWWDAFGNSTPSLKKFARKILGLTCSASGCERNWSVFEQAGEKQKK